MQLHEMAREMERTTFVKKVITDMPATVRARRRAPIRNSRRASSTHSGHWWPTGAGIMHSGQIGRAHREHRTRVSWSGCR